MAFLKKVSKMKASQSAKIICFILRWIHIYYLIIFFIKKKREISLNKIIGFQRRRSMWGYENKFTKIPMPHSSILLAKKIDDIIISFQQRWQNGSKLSPNVISKYPE